MSDNKNKQDGRDRDQVAGGQDYEVNYLVDKLGVSRQEVLDAIDAVGNKREDVENYLKGKSN